MPLMTGLASGGASVLGGVLGNIFGGDDRNKAAELQAQALKNILGVNAPSIEELKVALQKYQSAGTLTPEAEATINQAASQMAGVSTDPRLKQAQMSALSSLQDVGAGKLRPEDQAAIEKIRQATAQDEQAREQSILQNMQARGQGGSGAEIAAKLGSSQSAANRGLSSGLDVAGQASQRALQAIMGSGQLGGQIEAQEFGEGAQKAQAQDIINKYNSMNAQQVLGTNVGSRNAAQASNLANSQNIMNANTGVSNQQQYANTQAAQQNYANQMQKAQAVANAQQQAAGQAMKNAQATQKMWGGIGNSVGGGIAEYGALDQQENQFNQLMNTLKPKKTQAPSTQAIPAPKQYDAPNPMDYTGNWGE